ncbi:hypothetical protein ACGFY7_31295 [Streptomyces prunicolor]|uniref:hypothetical protein n=1 Tax=Streptomyces prunicolor TaxID=67348 RepID=UPI00371954EE
MSANASFSGMLKAAVTRNASAYAPNPAASTNAPLKPRKNTGFWITSLMFRMTSTNTWSSLRANVGMIAHAKT